MTCSLHSKADPAHSVGEVIIAVAFRASLQEPSYLQQNMKEMGGSSRSLNVFGQNLLAHGRLRRNSSFNSKTEPPVPSKPVQHVTPVVHVTNATNNETSSDDEEEVHCVRSARGRINSLYDLDADTDVAVRDGSAATLKLSITSTTSQGSNESDELPEEFKGKSRSALVRMIVTLRDVVTEQDEKLLELQNYIDTRLASILDANPALLETPNTSDTK